MFAAVKRTPYWPVITHPVLGRVLPGIGLSSIGDGMSTVAVPWLALQLAPPGERGTWVALAAAAYTLPGALGAVAFDRFLRGRPGAQLAGWDAVARAVLLGAIPLAHLAGALSPALYVVLLALSSLLSAWGKAGRYTLLAELLPKEHVLAGNAVVNVLLEFSTVGGPPLAAVVIAWAGGPTSVIACDAASFAVLALTYTRAVPREVRGTRVKGTASRSAGFQVIGRDRHLLTLMALTFGFFTLFGPVTVALPLHVAGDLHGSAAQMAGYYTAFGIGAVASAAAAGYMRSWPMQGTTVGIVLCFGAALLPLGLSGSLVVGCVAFGLCGLIWGPFPSTTTLLFQRAVPTDELATVLAARGAVTSLSSPAGALVAAPLVAAVTARGTLVVSAVGMLVLGALTGVVFLAQRSAPSATEQPQVSVSGESSGAADPDSS